jgi:riboflavin kinase / FMN adenylyltransferase
VTPNDGGLMDVVEGVEALNATHGRLFLVIGVFDGIHRGHAYLLDHLAREAAKRHARPAVITFDHHPDEVIRGSAPPLLLHPAERLELLERAGVAVTVVQHFDEAVRRTPYDAFVGAIGSRVDLAGFLMTPDAAFGFERRGTPEAVAELGRRDGFDVVVVPPFTLDGRPVRSSEIRSAIGAGDLATARELLGREITVTGVARSDGGGTTLEFEMPMALPPTGTYGGSVGGRDVELEIGADGSARVRPAVNGADPGMPLRVVLRSVD